MNPVWMTGGVRFTVVDGEGKKEKKKGGGRGKEDAKSEKSPR